MHTGTRAHRHNSRWVFVLCALMTYALIFCSLSALAYAQGFPDSEQLFSPSVGQRFYEVAYEVANSEDASGRQAEQAIIFLIATTQLDSRANYVLPDMIKFACRYSERDYSGLVRNLLKSYVDNKADLEVTREAIRYLLERLNSREEREQLLREILGSLGGKNGALDSELATLLGLLMAEKADNQSAASFFMQAYSKNKYNQLAFEKLNEVVPEQIEPVMHLEHLRLALGENPLDMEAALGFAQYAEKLQLYQSAADTYEYCVDLFGYLYPSEALPAYIYLPWALSSYNTLRNPHRCLQIAEHIRQSGRFDLLAEAIAGRAAAKIGDGDQASRIFRAAEEKALEFVVGNPEFIGNNELQTMNYEQLAWFYCFAVPDADNALNWANKAYSTDPNSATTAAILAYSLVMNGQTDWARPLVDNYEHTQISDMALARIQLAEGEQSSALKTLKSVIASDPGSLEAEQARDILAEQGSEYIPPSDPDIILTTLRSSFSGAVVPRFVEPEKAISVQLNVRGSKFSYGSNFGGSIAITNNSSEPFVISDNSLFKGNIRVDADISGDLKKAIPNLVSVKIQPSLPVEPGRSILVPLRLVTGELRQILLAHPQASLDIEFTAYLDPVITSDGKIVNRLGSIKPANVAVKRPGVELVGKFLRNRFDSLSKGQQGQKIKTAQLFTGLLLEQHAMANREPLYKFMCPDWMPDLLKSALIHNLACDDWVARVHTMSGMLSLPMDYELMNGVAENLNDTAHWPARLMAIYLLARNRDSNFGKVLDWTAKYDSNKLVRDMAIALGGAVPQVREPTSQPTPNNLKKEAPDSKI